MEKHSEMDTTLVYGFIESGKTTFIQDCMEHDYFYKYGSTLILCFESGETEYNEKLLSERNTSVAYYEAGEDAAEFCRRSIAQFSPDRIYVEMNSMIPGLREQFPDTMEIRYATARIDFSTLPLYLNNLRQFVVDMVKVCDQVTFRSCSTKEQLAPYAQLFRLMNAKAVYLREDPMGYHEKAFDLFLPYNTEDPEITITEEGYIAFCLDAGEHPQRYEGKKLRFALPLEIRTLGALSEKDNGMGEKEILCGRSVMTCCMADIQFMGCLLCPGKLDPEEMRGWSYVEGTGKILTGKTGLKRLAVSPDDARPASLPDPLIMSAVNS